MEQKKNIQPVDKSQPTEVVKAPNNSGTPMKVDGTRHLTEKERAYIEYRLANPRSTKPEAVRAVYDVREGLRAKTLANMATAIERRPAVMAVLQAHAIQAEKNLKVLANRSTEFALSGTKEGAMYAGVAEKVNNSILDRVHGKATQRVDLNTTSLSINIDLSSNEPVTEVTTEVEEEG